MKRTKKMQTNIHLAACDKIKEIAAAKGLKESALMRIWIYKGIEEATGIHPNEFIGVKIPVFCPQCGKKTVTTRINSKGWVCASCGDEGKWEYNA